MLTIVLFLLFIVLQIAREAAKQQYIEMGINDIDRARPIADPQDNGLLKGSKHKVAAEGAAAAAAVAGADEAAAAVAASGEQQ